MAEKTPFMAGEGTGQTADAERGGGRHEVTGRMLGEVGAAAREAVEGAATTAFRVTKTLKREAESLWDIPPDTYSSRACGALSVPAQLVAVAVLGSFQFGYNLAALNTSKAFVILDFGWCKNMVGGHFIGCNDGLVYGSLVTTAVFAGAAVGCLVGGRITDFGRRMALLGTHCFCILGCGLSAGAEGFVSLLLARLVVGVSVGLFTVCVPMYIAEVTPDARRGFFGTFHQLFITVGIFCGTVLGLAFGKAPEDHVVYKISTFQQAWWRVLLGAPMLVSILAVVLYLWCYPYETPNFMVEKKQRVKATALLREIYGREDVDAEMHRLLHGHYEMKIQRAQQLNVWKALAHHSAYRRVIVIACLLSMFQQFSGINVLVANSNNLYSSLKLPSATITGLTVGFSALNVILTIVTVPLVDTVGRRTLLLFSMTVQFVAMAISFIANLIDKNNTVIQWVTVACVYVFIVGFAVGYGPVLWIYLHEIFPPEIKQGAAGLASALNWIATIAIVLPSDFLLNSNFSIFVGICTGALLFILIVTVLFVKETKGLSIEESPYFKGKPRALSGSAFQDRLNPSFFQGHGKDESGGLSGREAAAAGGGSNRLCGRGGAGGGGVGAGAGVAEGNSSTGSAAVQSAERPLASTNGVTTTGSGSLPKFSTAAQVTAGFIESHQQLQQTAVNINKASRSTGVHLKVQGDPHEGASPHASEASGGGLARGYSAADTTTTGGGGRRRELTLEPDRGIAHPQQAGFVV